MRAVASPTSAVLITPSYLALKKKLNSNYITCVVSHSLSFLNVKEKVAEKRIMNFQRFIRNSVLLEYEQSTVKRKK